MGATHHKSHNVSALTTNFVELVMGGTYPVAPGAWVDELGRSTGLERERLAASEYLRRSCELMGTTPGEIAAPGKRREISRKRYMITALAIERWGITAKGLSGVVGRRPEAVTRWAYRGAEMRQQSEEFSGAYEKLDRELALWQRGSR
jgi:hypothetical protein